MVRIILGIIVGFVVWSILWGGGDEVLARFFPDWYGAHQWAFEKAVVNRTGFDANPSILFIHIIRSILASLISGYIAALVANENRRTPLILGILLLLVGIVVQMYVWGLLPIWYHLVFLILLIPGTIAGAKLRRTA
jgi:heme A synthase